MRLVYTPATLGADLLAAAGGVLAWVAAALAAALGIVFIFVGMRKGIAWAAGMVGAGDSGADLQSWDSATGQWISDDERYERDTYWDERLAFWESAGLSEEAATRKADIDYDNRYTPHPDDFDDDYR